MTSRHRGGDVAASGASETASAGDGRAVEVAFISSSGEFGGAEVLMLSLLKSMERRWVRSVIFLGDGPVVEEVRRLGVEVEVLPRSRRWGLVKTAPRLRRSLRASGVKVVHANSMRAATVAALAATGTNIRVIWLKVDCGRDGWKARLLARGCDQIVGISHTVNETFRGRTRDRLHVVYPGVPDWHFDRPTSRAMVEETLGCPPAADVLVLSARLSPSKGQLDLLEITPTLLSRRPGVRIALLGGDATPQEAYADFLRRRAVELGISEVVSFLGHRSSAITSTAEAVRFVSGCDLLIAPSRHDPRDGWREGFGLSPVEAMSVGTPVVAYRHGSFPEVLGDCAYLVPEGDLDALATAILEVLASQSMRSRMARCGLNRARTRYRLEDSVASMEDRYLAALTSRRESRHPLRRSATSQTAAQ